MKSISLQVNGRDHSVTIESRTHLADCLRDELLLTGTHLGCEQGVCGACTLMFDGQPVRSCLTLAALCDGADLRTIEGFANDELMAALRAAFKRHHALQCGYCTPGMLITAYDIVRRLGAVEETRIRAELAGNICRCTGYAGIIAAISDVMINPPAASIRPIPQAASPGMTLSPAAETPAAVVRLPDAAQASGDRRAILTRKLTLPVSSEVAWALLSRVEQVVALLPGAILTGVDDDWVTGSFTASIGPMTATFTGQAVVAYDSVQLTGVVSGSGNDPLSRTAADGGLSFRLVPTGNSSCSLYTDISYRLKGPLAQFGRPAVVASVVDQLLDRFTTNIAAVAGGDKANLRPLSMLRSVGQMVLGALKRLLQKLDG